jgi:N-acetylglucosaminyl-diphospho-decaprenol L-rhamnosyltransferase
MNRAPSSPARLLVVVVNFRTAELTIDCLRSLEDEVRGLGDVHVVVTDNGSNDGSAERIADAIVREHWNDWAELLPLEHNRGYAAGNNAAIRPALERDPPDYVLLLNSDTLARPAALAELLRFMDAAPAVGIAGSRIEDLDGNQVHSGFRFPSMISELESGLRWGVFSRLVPDRVVAPAPVNVAHAVDWVAGASMIVRRQVFEQIGLLDEGYFLYFEEVDFCFKARRAGWSCWYLPESRVVHLVGRSTGVTVRQNPPRRPRYWWESRYRFFTRNYGRLYTFATDLIWMAAYATWRLRRRVQRKPDNDPPHMLADFLRFRLHPTRRTEPQTGDL